MPISALDCFRPRPCCCARCTCCAAIPDLPTTPEDYPLAAPSEDTRLFNHGRQDSSMEEQWR